VNRKHSGFPCAMVYSFLGVGVLAGSTCARGEDEPEKRSKMNQDDERADHEESIDAGDCDAKTGVSYRFVRAELCPAGER
jgi:hypothetical protein